MDKKEAIQRCRDMWYWIYEETLRLKRKVNKNEYFRAHGITFVSMPANGCYLCEYMRQRGEGINCAECPIRWSPLLEFEDSCDCISMGSPYLEWYSKTNKDYMDCARLALCISGLPERDDD